MLTRLRNFWPRRGFSLIELMVAVTIVGILAAIAVPMYSKYIRKSRTSEAVSNLGSIAMFEETYLSENESYITLEPNPATVPTKNNGTGRLAFSANLGNWPLIGRVLPDGQMVYYQYEARAGQFGSGGAPVSGGTGDLVNPSTGYAPGNGACSGIANITPNNSSSLNIEQIANSNWYYITAAGDQDGDGTCSLFVKVIDRPDIIVENDIE